MTQRLNTNKNAPPLYIQVKEDLKKKIESGYWKPGDKITSEWDLCEYYDVSRITVREAINELVWEEYLIRQRAKGTFVLNYKEKDYYTHVKSYTYEMNELGQTAHTYMANVKKIKANEFLAKQLNIHIGNDVIELCRVRGSENRYPVYFKTYWAFSDIFSLNSEDYYGSFYEMLKKEGIILENIKEYLEAIRPNKEVRTQLKIDDNMPVLKRVRHAKNSSGDFIEYTECYYVGENYRYYIDLELKK